MESELRELQRYAALLALGGSSQVELPIVSIVVPFWGLGFRVYGFWGLGFRIERFLELFAYPKGPCTHIVYTLALTSSLYRYFGANVYTI